MARIKAFMDLFGNYTAAGDMFLAAGDSVEAVGDFRDNQIKLTRYADIAWGGDGKDLIYGYGGNDELYGQNGRDTLYGGDGRDKLYGGEGNDVLSGEAGDDTLDGGIGNDLLVGGSGSDWLRGGDGDDQVYGGDGASTLDGGAGNDKLIGGSVGDWALMDDLAGNNLYDGNEGFDVAYYYDFNGRISVTPNSDGTYSAEKSLNGRVYGTDILAEVENIIGTQNADRIVGYDADDYFQGQDGNDLLIGNGGRDTLAGGGENDILIGGGGYDTLLGGAGADTFRFDQTDMQTGTVGPNGTFLCDLIGDYQAVDRIDLSRIDANTDLAGDQAFILTQRHLAGASSEIFVGLVNDGASVDTYSLTGYVTGTSSGPDFHITVQVEDGFNLFRDGVFIL